MTLISMGMKNSQLKGDNLTSELVWILKGSLQKNTKYLQKICKTSVTEWTVQNAWIFLNICVKIFLFNF
jgi:hypothetical protein